LLTDEGQVLNESTAVEVSRYFRAEDKPMVLVHVYRDERDRLQYLELPYVEVAALIKQSLEVELVYWGLREASDSAAPFNELRFGLPARSDVAGVRVRICRSGGGTEIHRVAPNHLGSFHAQALQRRRL